MISILTWISIFAGALLVLLLLISIIGGLDIDVDIDTGGTDIGADSGGVGILKGFLTFISVGSWVAKICLDTGQGSFLATVIAICCGILAFVILNYLFKYLLKNEESVNWKMEDTIFQKGEVYLRIPEGGEGIVIIDVKGARREFKAKSFTSEALSTGTPIVVMEIEGEKVVVRRQDL